MEFIRYLESFPITKVHSFLSNFNFTIFLIASTKKIIFFANRPIFPFDKCPTTTLHFSTTTANLSNSFSSSNRALRNYPSAGFYFIVYSLSKIVGNSSSIKKFLSDMFIL